MTSARIKLTMLILSLVLQFSAAVVAQESFNGPPIKLGMSTVLSGPSQYLGQAMSRGIAEVFSRVNSEGGIQGRELELIIMDDAYVPDIAAANSTHLIDQEEVLAIIGNVGTPTAESVMPVVASREVVFFGAFTGSNSLRAATNNEFVFNYRASYEQEMAAIVEHILASNISPRRIALLLQADEAGTLDGFGRAGLNAARTALEAVGFRYTDSLTQAKYVANSLETGSAIIEVLDASYLPEAFILVGSYQPSSHFIQYMHRLYPTANFYNLSFAGAGALAASLQEAESEQALDFGERIFMTQVVPPIDQELSSLPGDLVEREAYFTAQFFVAALGSIEGDITRASIKRAMNTLFLNSAVDAPQNASVIASSANQASDYVVLTRFSDGNWISVQTD